MANTDKVTDFDDPFQVADLAKREGAEGLLRLADYFESTGQQTPAAVRTALAMSRGPGIFPAAGAFLQKAKPKTETRGTSIYDAGALGPIQSWSDDLVVMAANQGRPEAVAERERRTGSFLGSRSTAVPSSAVEAVPAASRPSDWVTARLASTQTPVPAAASVPKLPLREPKGMDLGVVPVPPPDARPADLLGPFFRPVAEEDLPPEGIRLPIEPGPTLSASVPDTAPTVSRIAPSDLKTPESQPIPTASAPVTKDAAAPVASVVPSTGPQTPAGKPDAEGKAGLPAPSSEGAGGDVLGGLGLGQALVRALEGSGSVIAGRDLRSGAADTLGERMKQIEALRAKREEQSLEQQRERATWGASNRATLASFMAQYKDRPEVVEALRAQEPGADTTKPSDFLKNVVGSLTTPPKVAGMEAGRARTEAGTGQMLERTATGEALRPGKVAKLAADTELARARTAKTYKDMELAGAKLALDERKTLEEAQQAKDPFKKLEKLNTVADKKEFGGFATLAGDLADLERVAPGFVTQGKVPEWLTREQQLLGQNWPSSSDPRVVDFLAAYGKMANAERHRLYGSAQTEGELRSFMKQLNEQPLSAGPQVLARQVKRFADASGRVAKGRLSRYSNVFGTDAVDTVLGPEWKPLFDEGGVFASQGSPFVATRSLATEDGAPEAATVTIRRKTDGKTKIVPAADRTKWLANPEFEEVK